MSRHFKIFLIIFFIAASIYIYFPLQLAKLFNLYSFTLWVSNQSFAITPVDIQIEVDGKLVAKGLFHVETQHTIIPFGLNLRPGKHSIHIWSEKGMAEKKMEFEIQDQNVGIVEYWYYPDDHYHPTPKNFTFRIQNEPLGIM